jgi:signal peptide peptidase SppA
MQSDRLSLCMRALLCEPWMVRAETHRALFDIVLAHQLGGATELAQHAAAAAMPENPAPCEYDLRDGVALIPVDGVIGRKFDNVLQSSGVVSVDVLERLVTQAAAAPDVRAIVLAFDSPGGTVTGVPEAAAAIRAARAMKPVVAYADGMMDSAAYYLGSQAQAVYATPSARVGSVGIYMALLDSSGFYAREGLRVELFRSGPDKGVGMPGTTLTDAQRAGFQARVDALAAQFKAAVRDGRQRDISDDAMQGADYAVDEARAAGLIDGVTTLDRAVSDARAMANMRTQRR